MDLSHVIDQPSLALPGNVPAVNKAAAEMVPVGELCRAVDQLETLFLRTEADLSYVHRKLDTELSAKYDSVAQHTMDPLALLTRITALKTSYAQASAAGLQLLARKERVNAALRVSLVATADLARDLQHATNVVKPSQPSEAETVMRATHRAQGGGSARCSSHGPGVPSSSYGGADGVAASIASDSLGGSNTTPKLKEGPVRSSALFVPVTEQEFDSVSSLVIGRNKLADINKVYEKLHGFFQQQPKKFSSSSNPLTTKEMAAMGLKITGATGEAKLKVLRQLKLISMSNKDKSVKLLFSN